MCDVRITDTLISDLKNETNYSIRYLAENDIAWTLSNRDIKVCIFFILEYRLADDIAIGADVVNQSACVVFGNPCLAFETLNGLGLSLGIWNELAQKE